MSANAPRSRQLPRSRTRVHSDRLSDDETIRDELADGLAGVGVGDLVDFVGIKPDLTFTAAGDGCGEPLLSAEVDPVMRGNRSVNWWEGMGRGLIRSFGASWEWKRRLFNAKSVASKRETAFGLTYILQCSVVDG